MSRLDYDNMTRAVWQQVVIAIVRAGVASLVEELDLAGVDGERLVGARADELAVADVVGPRGAAVRLAGEGVALAPGLDRPGAAQVARGEGAEEAALRPDGLDDHEVALARHAVDLHGLEQVVLGVAEDGLVLGAEAAGEVADGHAGAVDLAVVAAEEEVHVLVVADDGLVDGARVGLDLALEQGLGPCQLLASVGSDDVRYEKAVGPHWYAMIQTSLGLKWNRVGATVLRLMAFCGTEPICLKSEKSPKFMEPHAVPASCVVAYTRCWPL
ncbi:hypothetical protein PG990_002008 [Apiospora arundinis]